MAQRNGVGDWRLPWVAVDMRETDSEKDRQGWLAWVKGCIGVWVGGRTQGAGMGHLGAWEISGR